MDVSRLQAVRCRRRHQPRRATWQVSIRRACRALPVNRSTYHYRSRRAGQAHLSERMIFSLRERYRRVQRRGCLIRCGRAGCGVRVSWGAVRHPGGGAIDKQALPGVEPTPEGRYTPSMPSGAPPPNCALADMVSARIVAVQSSRRVMFVGLGCRLDCRSCHR
jgi:hypothetical protein